ncbi:carboxymuconolactone decarboxylase family protein [Nakamurella sp. YIM 132087]|uniref:Carboxymuconolactone decarboxylase family protein n=1 Tax=Nakamurella alba TaxID=2665158 RepID=A0A7K1FPR9_9ACTN|nr:carboxymuconolactone decarboxylase family protein [Nakamurella alba]MTD16070.1 carboxymuconolactone decarboxylase family protein [Nakamurella alba]
MAAPLPRAVFPAPAPVQGSRARIPLTLPGGVFGKLLGWYSRRTYGKVMDPGLALVHHKRLMVAVVSFEQRIAKAKALDPRLKALAELATAVRVECEWCIDFGFHEFVKLGLDAELLAEVPRWRGSERFSPLERDVLEYADAMTATPPTVTDDLAGRLREELGVRAFVELTKMISVENERARFNAALGLASQGFSESCRVPVR